jgi:hypothetical protein
MTKIAFIIAMLCALFGLIDMLANLDQAGSAPQQAAAAAMGCAWAVIPYCIARAVQEIARPSEPGSGPSKGQFSGVFGLSAEPPQPPAGTTTTAQTEANPHLADWRKGM